MATGEGRRGFRVTFLNVPTRWHTHAAQSPANYDIEIFGTLEGHSGTANKGARVTHGGGGETLRRCRDLCAYLGGRGERGGGWRPRLNDERARLIGKGLEEGS